MTGHDDLGPTLTRWFEADVAGPAPAGRFQQAIEATRNRRPRPALLAGVGSAWVGTESAVAAARVSWRTVVLIALLIVGLAVGALIAGGGQRQLPAVIEPARNGLIAYDAGGDIFVGDPITGTSTAIVTGPAIEGRAIFAPDGSRIAFWRAREDYALAVYGWPGGDIVVVRPDGSDERVITTEKGFLGGYSLEPSGGIDRVGPFFIWTPDSTSIVVHRADGSLVAFDAAGSADPRDLTPPLLHMPYSHFDFTAEVAWFLRPPSGDQILFSTCDGGLSVTDLGGSNATVLVDPSWSGGFCFAPNAPSWSPDGSKIAFVHRAGTDPESRQVSVMNADGSDLRRLSRAPGAMVPGGSVQEGLLVWSPDSSEIAFQRWVTWGETTAMLVVDVESGAEREVATSIGGSWSPDGRSMLTVSGSRLVIVDVETGRATELPWEVESETIRQGSWQRLTTD